jgi:hypothetical protein
MTAEAGERPSGRRARRAAVRCALFVAIASLVYFTGVVMLLIAAAVTGRGGVSCRGDGCGVVVNFTSDIAPWGMVAWIVVSLTVASAAVTIPTRRRRSADPSARR